MEEKDFASGVIRKDLHQVTDLKSAEGRPVRSGSFSLEFYSLCGKYLTIREPMLVWHANMVTHTPNVEIEPRLV